MGVFLLFYRHCTLGLDGNFELISTIMNIYMALITGKKTLCDQMLVYDQAIKFIMIIELI